MTSFPRENGVRFIVDQMIIIINKHIFLNKSYMPLVDLSEKWSGCNGSLIEETASVSIKGHIVIVNQAENCSIYERAESVVVCHSVYQTLKILICMYALMFSLLCRGLEVKA